MVSLWPWKGDDTSPASFEKTLSTLSAKHNQTSARLDGLRQQARRFKALWTLYSVFIYLLYTTIDVLVLGWQNWGYWEYSAVVGGPFAIYIVRTIASRIFEYRISRTQSQLDALNKQRDETIEKLKVATKYNSTQQLLEKYGGDAPSSPNNKSKTAAAKNNSKRKDEQQQQQQYNVAASSGRTGLPPPPTANIKRRSQDGFSPSQSQQQQQLQLQPNYLQGKPLPAPPSSNSFAEQEQASFAPNAFPPYPLPPPSQSQYDKAAAAGVGTKWYDRFLDVLLGEDETSPKNRIVLICQNCRLVNGQAPPGVKGLDELGKWRCGGCGAWNGEESEAKKVLDSIQQESASEVADEKHAPNVDGGEEEDGDEEDEAAGKKEEESTSDDKSDEEEQVQTTGSNSDKKQQSSSGVSTRTRSKRAKK